MPVRRSAAVLAGAAVLAAAPVAAASTISLSLTPAKGILQEGTTSGKDVYLFQGTIFQQQFLVDLADDAGAPVTGCLADGAAVHLVDDVTQRELGTATCAISDGRFHIFPSPRISIPTQVSARVDANTPLTSATPVSAVSSVPVIVVVQPEILDTSPAVAKVNRFPITGRVKVPRANTAGAVALERKKGAKWLRIARKPLPKSGAFRFLLTQGPGIYRIHFIAKSGSGYVDNASAFRIRRSG